MQGHSPLLSEISKRNLYFSIKGVFKQKAFHNEKNFVLGEPKYKEFFFQHETFVLHETPIAITKHVINNVST